MKIQKEMLLFENVGKFSDDFFAKSILFLLTVKPTSVESERAIFAAGFFATEIRSCLGDTTLYVL